VPGSEAQEYRDSLTWWELTTTIELLSKKKFTIDEDENRILTLRYRDRLKILAEPKSPLFEN